MSKDISIDIKQIKRKAKTAVTIARKYITFIFVMTVLLIYGFLIFRISNLSQAEPDETAITEQLNAVKRLKIDQNAIDKIEELEDQNVGVQSLFESARDNPFQD